MNKRERKYEHSFYINWLQVSCWHAWLLQKNEESIVWLSSISFQILLKRSLFFISSSDKELQGLEEECRLMSQTAVGNCAYCLVIVIMIRTLRIIVTICEVILGGGNVQNQTFPDLRYPDICTVYKVSTNPDFSRLFVTLPIASSAISNMAAYVLLILLFMKLYLSIYFCGACTGKWTFWKGK